MSFIRGFLEGYDRSFQLLGLIATSEITAILVATGGLLGFISLRNAHLSERSRAAVTEALYNVGENTDRKSSLIAQSRLFISRYKWTGWAFVCTAAAFALFFVGSMLCGGAIGATKMQGMAADLPVPEPTDPMKIYAGYIYVAGFAFFMLGFVIIVLEFMKGAKTLKRNHRDIDPNWGRTRRTYAK